MNDETVDLIVTDPPFATGQDWKNTTNPLTAEEAASEITLLASWGITTPQEAADAGVQWPADDALKFVDHFSWDDSHGQVTANAVAYRALTPRCRIV